MAGHTGKRARAAGICTRCGKKIADAVFMRDKDGDQHAMMADGSPGCPVVSCMECGKPQSAHLPTCSDFHAPEVK